MDIVTTRYFEKFLEEQNIQNEGVANNFEKFINYIVLSPKNIANFELLSIGVGGGYDAAIDGLAIVLNNRFIQNMSELEAILNTGMEFSVEFYFIQSKTTAGFESKEILNFGTGVCDIFKEENKTKKILSPALNEKYEMIRKIIDNYEYTKDRKCFLYYVTTGTYVEDDNLKSAKDTIVRNLSYLGLFEEENIELNTFGNKFIRKQYELTKIQNSATFKLESKIDLPFIQNVQEAYFAVMPIKEYLNIVVDTDSKIRRGIFELNVRDFAGIDDNRVNQDIVSTILSENKHSFGLLNNGVTIVGKSLTKGQGQYTIKNFYIVNGCQTTNVLFNQKDKIDETMWISVKIVITDQDKIIKDIVKATNNQTEVEEIQLISMDEYQEELESYFKNFNNYQQLYYERREGQYRSNPDISPIQIVTFEKQVKSFGATFLREPHTSSRFVGKLYDDINKSIFLKDHKPIIYYTSALINYYLEHQFLNDKIKNEYLKFQYHIQLIIFYEITKDERKIPLNSNKMDEFCQKIILEITDEKRFDELVNFSMEVINNVIKNINDTEANKTQNQVNAILRYVDTGWTEEKLKNVRYFVSIIDDYLAPFDVMKKDGDLRFNFLDRLNELSSIINEYTLDESINIKQTYLNISVESLQDDRQLRKRLSEEIYNIVNEKVLRLKNLINVSKKYE